MRPIRNILQLALTCKVRARTVSSQEIRKTFSKLGAFTKQARASVIAERFPELAPKLPPYRKPWMNEDYWMAIFDAITLYFALFHSSRRGRELANGVSLLARDSTLLENDEDALRA